MGFFREVLGGAKVSCRVCGAANSAADEACFNCRSSLAPASPSAQPAPRPSRPQDSRVPVTGTDHMVEAARVSERKSRETKPPTFSPPSEAVRTSGASAKPAPKPAPRPAERPPSLLSSEGAIPPPVPLPEPRVAVAPPPQVRDSPPSWQDQYASAPAIPLPPAEPSRRSMPPPLPTDPVPSPEPSPGQGVSVGHLVLFAVLSVIAMSVSRVAPCFGMAALGFFLAAIATQFSARLEASKKLERLGCATLALAVLLALLVR